MAALREVPRGDLPKLRDQLTACLPHSVTVHGVIDVGLQYGTLEGRKIRVLATAGLPPTSLVVTTPMVGQGENQSLSLFWDSDKDDDESVAASLSSIPDFKWDESVFFYACSKHLMEKVERMIREGQLGTGKLRPSPATPSHLYTLTSQPLPPTSSLSNEFEIRPIDAKYAEHMLNFWEYKYSESVDSYRHLLLTLPGYAVFLSRPTTSGEKEEATSGDGMAAGAPIAWTHLSKNNTMGNTFTHPEYRKRGLARAVTLALAAQMVRQNGRTSVYIADDNEASIGFHESLGFKRECPIFWQSFNAD